MIALRQENGSSLSLEREIARGGEGKIYTIVGDCEHVAKIFYKRSPEKAAKLHAMLANPPRDLTFDDSGHISIAWPTERILDQRGECVGFIMPYIDHRNSFPLLKLYNPRDRRELHVSFTWTYLLCMAKNLAIVIHDLHKKGYVVGDLNESNILVTAEALVTLVDCDSIQVPKENKIRGEGKFFRCTVGKPEYTPPELQGKDFSQIDRKQYHDNFCLAILIFLMLMEGRHPFTGVWAGKGAPPTLEQYIKKGYFPYVHSRSHSRFVTVPKFALPFDTLHPQLQILMQKCFVTCHDPIPARFRPSAKAWYKALDKAAKYLQQCPNNSLHIYSQHLGACPWCERVQLGIPDPFPSQSPPPVKRHLWHWVQRWVQRWRYYLLVIARCLLVVATIAVYILGARIWPDLSHWLHLQPWRPVWFVIIFAPLILAVLAYRKLLRT